MQQAIIREKVLENQVGSLHVDKGGSLPNTGTYAVAEDSSNDLLPLYLCLGNPAASSSDSGCAGATAFMTTRGNSNRSLDDEPTVTIYEVIGMEDPQSDSDTDDSQWEEEGQADPYDAERLQAEIQAAKQDPTYLSQLYWAQRKAQRRYRAASDKFGPSRSFKKRKLARRFTRRGPPAPGAPARSSRKGFFIGEHFVSLDHIPDSELNSYFQGRTKDKFKSKPSSDARCFNCGQAGHYSKNCPQPQKCFNCGQLGHQKARCPQLRGSNRSMVVWGSPSSQPAGDYLMMDSSARTSQVAEGSLYQACRLEAVQAVDFHGVISTEAPFRCDVAGPTAADGVCEANLLEGRSTPDPFETEDPWGQAAFNLAKGQIRSCLPPSGQAISPIIADTPAATFCMDAGEDAVEQTVSAQDLPTCSSKGKPVKYWKLMDGFEGFGHGGANCLIKDEFGTVQVVPTSLVELPDSADAMEWLSFSDELLPQHADRNASARQVPLASGGGLTLLPATCAPSQVHFEAVTRPSPQAGARSDRVGLDVQQGRRNDSDGVRSIPVLSTIPTDYLTGSSTASILGTEASGSRRFVVSLGASQEDAARLAMEQIIKSSRNNLLETTLHESATGVLPEAETSADHQSDEVIDVDISDFRADAEVWEEVFPVYSWEEEDTPNRPSPSGAGAPNMAQAYLHSSTRIPGMEGLLPDTGAVDDLSGGDFVDRQSVDAAAHGHRTEWQLLQKPKCVSGVGDNAKVCTHRALVPGQMEDGTLFKYCPSVVPSSAIPPLLGCNTMASLNVYFGTKKGLFVMIPNGSDDDIKWPPGTKIIKCRKAPSGHWLLIASAWQKPRREAAVPTASASFSS